MEGRWSQKTAATLVLSKLPRNKWTTTSLRAVSFTCHSRLLLMHACRGKRSAPCLSSRIILLFSWEAQANVFCLVHSSFGYAPVRMRADGLLMRKYSRCKEKDLRLWNEPRPGAVQWHLGDWQRHRAVRGALSTLAKKYLPRQGSFVQLGHTVRDPCRGVLDGPPPHIYTRRHDVQSRDFR